MNARLPEDTPSNQPSDRRETSGDTPSHLLLNETMRGPRMWAAYLDEQLSTRFPSGGYDETKARSEEAMLRKILGQLRMYEHSWLKKHAGSSLDEFRSLGFTEPEELQAYDELTLHLINQYIMPHWQKVLAPHISPKLDIRSLAAAQIKLAVESTSLQSFQRDQEAEFEDVSYIDRQITDIDTMIGMIQLMMNAPLDDLGDIVITPKPILPGADAGFDFIAFTPDYRSEYILTPIPSQELGLENQTPGHLARVALARTKISSMSFWPEFNSRDSLHSFMMAKSAAQEVATATDPAIEETRQKIGEWLRTHTV